MQKSSVRLLFLVLAILFLVLSAISFFKGYDKLTNYENYENYPSLNVNAYVGGDAYNYIINGNYATGFFVLSMGLLVCSVLCIGTRTIIDMIPEKAGRVENQLPINDLPDL